MKKKILITLIAVCTMLIAFGIINASADTYGELYYDIIDGKAIVAECDKNIKGELLQEYHRYEVKDVNYWICNNGYGVTVYVVPIGRSLKRMG